MREIKFRVWDNHLNKYIKDYITGTSLSLNILFKNGSIVNGKNSLVFEQYIGLKDCNGIEVYEGDRLKVDYSNQIGDFCTTFTIINDIRFIDLEVIYAERIEVIGNIYENTELLLEK